MEVLVLMGIPASGKSTYAVELVEKGKGGWVRTNKDSLRAMLDAGIWSKSNEKFVLEVRDFIISNALARGRNVIVDDTNLEPYHLERVKEIVAAFNKQSPNRKPVTVRTKLFEVDLEEAIARDCKRPNGVGERVIRRFHKQLYRPEPVTAPEPYYVEGLPYAILCDIDGTLADGHFYEEGRRGPYDWKRVGEDDLKPAIRDVLVTYYTQQHPHTRPIPRIILFSGRSAVCRTETEEWLKKYDVPYDELHMRAVGDEKRKDSLVKHDLFDDHIRGKYNVLFVLDDRNQVVEKWRELGLTCFQVSPGTF